MIFDKTYFGPERFTAADARYEGSSFGEVRDAIFANSYYVTWGGAGEPPLPVYEVTLGRALAGFFSLGRRWLFQQASDRTVDSSADLRWGENRQGFRRILHPNGVCLTGTWEIDSDVAAKAGYTGYFSPGSKGLVIARYSSCCTETRRGRYRSLAMVGKLFPTTDPNDTTKYRPAHFITQEDFGGSKVADIGEVELRNAPDLTPWRRGAGLPVLLVTALVLARTDRQTLIRQLYEISELAKANGIPSRTPEFIRFVTDVNPNKVPDEDLDFRDEILGRIYDRGHREPKRQLIFHIEVSDTGTSRGILAPRRVIDNWKRIGKIVFSQAVASYNGDFVAHFHHPKWRNDRNNPATVVRTVKPRPC